MEHERLLITVLIRLGLFKSHALFATYRNGVNDTQQMTVKNLTSKFYCSI